VGHYCRDTGVDDGVVAAVQGRMADTHSGNIRDRIRGAGGMRADHDVEVASAERGAGC
jgi:hypothetical protein